MAWPGLDGLQQPQLAINGLAADPGFRSRVLEQKTEVKHWLDYGHRAFRASAFGATLA